MPGKVILLSILILGGCHAQGVKVTSTESAVCVIGLEGGGATIWHDGPWRPMVHPVRAPGGVEVTRRFPMDERSGQSTDHPHHTSLWLAHGDVNGFDFWHDRSCKVEPSSDPQTTRLRDGVLVIRDYVWMAKSAETAYEKRVVAVQCHPDLTTIDVTSTLAPAGPSLSFGDTKEGTMALRLRDELALRGPGAQGRSRNSADQHGDAIWGQRARWVAYEGEIDGVVVTVAMFDHPSNHRHPTWWHARPYGLVAANPFGAQAFGESSSGSFHLQKGEQLTLRYRILISSDPLSDRQLNAAWLRWTDQAVSAGTT